MGERGALRLSEEIQTPLTNLWGPGTFTFLHWPLTSTDFLRMEKLRCKTCGCESLRPMQVVFEEEDEVDDLLGEEQESRFYSCQVCGDNWLSVKEKTADGECTVTFVHQMGTSPVLKRVAHMTNSVVISEESVDEWEYFKGDQPVDESEWEAVLSDRRDTLKATCMN